MQINDLGREAIDEILTEAHDGMKRRTGMAWDLVLNGETGDLDILRDGKHLTMANVRPPELLKPVEGERIGAQLSEVGAALRYRSNLRRLILAATQAVSPVPGAADIPAALMRASAAIAVLNSMGEGSDLSARLIPGLRHDLYRILDHLTGNDHSGCSSAPSVADYGREACAMDISNEAREAIRCLYAYGSKGAIHERGGIIATGPAIGTPILGTSDTWLRLFTLGLAAGNGPLRVRLTAQGEEEARRPVPPRGMAKPKRAVPIEDDIAAVRAALREAEATSDGRDGSVVMLKDTLNGLLAEQRGEA